MTLHDQHTDRLAAGMSSDSTVATPEPTLADRLDELAQKWHVDDVDGIIRAFRVLLETGSESRALEALE